MPPHHASPPSWTEEASPPQPQPANPTSPPGTSRRAAPAHDSSRTGATPPDRTPLCSPRAQAVNSILHHEINPLVEDLPGLGEPALVLETFEDLIVVRVLVPDVAEHAVPARLSVRIPVLVR